jgi:probable rRNA maturation factor
MKLSVEFNNQTSHPLDQEMIRKVFEKTLEKSANCLENKDIQVSVALVEEKEMQEINGRYAGKDCATDVLSFGEYEKKEALCAEKSGNIFLGEIILCPSYIEKSAVENGVGRDYEMVYISSHGLLHLLGLDHGEEMFAIQDELAKFFVS